MSEDFDSDYTEDETMFELDDDEIDWGTDTFIPVLLPNEELTAEKQEKITEHFANFFTKRYPLLKLRFFQGSFINALNQSIFNPDDPRPLVLYICHKESVADNTSCINCFSEKVVQLLNEEFIIWPWDRTNMNHYRQFLKLLIENVGSEIASKIASYSYSKDDYPLLVCLAFQDNQYTILSTIKSEVQDKDMMYNLLCVARDDFDRPNNQDFIIFENQNKNWHIPNSHLTSIPSGSDQFQAIVNNSNIRREKIIRISAIENLIWSIQYSCEKKRIDDRNGHSPNEKELFYGCPLSMAEAILRNGFDDGSNQIHGDEYGHGFCFSSKRELCEKYTVSNEFKYDPKAIIKCRIVVYQDCLNKDNSDIFVVFRNEQILPEYLIVYNE